MNYYQEVQTEVLVDAAAYASSGRCMCTNQIAALFCMKLQHGCYFKSDNK